MIKGSKLALAIKFACIAGASSALFSTSLYAQEPDVEEKNVEVVRITGSRLAANPNLTAGTPVLSVSGEEANVRGNIRVEDFLNVLPQVFAGQASEVSNGATGTATLDLRGLGAQRTLVLIDGKRLPYGSSQTSPANVDIIPTQLIESVDILTGGASAVYGSDAIGGVANFVLKRDFEGVELGGQFSSNYNANDEGIWENVLNASDQPVPGSTWDGEETLVYALFGANTADGRGNVTIYASYEDRNEIVQADRIFSACTLGQASGEQSFGGFGCVGSGNFRLFGGNTINAFQEENGELVDFVGGPSQTFNFGAANFFQRPSKRYSFYSRGHYDITENLEIYADFSYTNNTSDAQIAPTASFGVFDINCGNPLIQDNQGIAFTDVFGCSSSDIANDTIIENVTAAHRNVEGGPRNSRLENSTWRFVGGLKGYINDTWQWSAFGQISETRDQSVSSEDFIVANVQQALLATTDADGNVVCIDTSDGCVPYNPFQRTASGESLITEDQLDFIQGVGLVNGETSQLVFGADIQANLGDYNISSPFTDNGIALLAGVEFRRDELASTPDEISQVEGGGFTGVGGATLAVAGEVEVSEFFAELEVPLVSEKTGIEELTLRGQYRFSDYDVAGNGTSNSFDTDAWGVSLTYAPIEDVKFRTQYNVAVRAPNVIELFEGVNTDLPDLNSNLNANGIEISDPCSSNAPIRTFEECARTGVTAEQFGSIPDILAGQTQSLTGGNTLLNPETADTFTFGVVITPSSIPNLSVTIDYFDISVEDAINDGIPAQTILDNCLNTGEATFCDLITRASFNGTLRSGISGVGFEQTNINIASLETSGIDLQVNYSFDIKDYGSVRLDYASTILDELSETSFPGAEAVDCAGSFGNACDRVPSPEYRHRFLATWNTPWDFDVIGTWRHFGETDNIDESDTLESTLDAVNYLDVTVSYNVLENLNLKLGVLNLLGEDTPVFSGAGPATFGNGNTYPTIFDTGTNVFFNVKASF